MKFRYVIVSIISFLYSSAAFSQYYVSDVDPCYLKWNKIENKEKGDIIFPDYIADKAFKVSFLRDKLTSEISQGIDAPIYRFPITIHPTNLNSNGMVTYTPRRMELISMPSRDNFSVPWIKHLVTHEYRHVAQLSALDCGFTRVMSYLIGEQMFGLTAATIPTYFYEGDAVTAETQFTIFGRGKQASFNTPLRALVLEGKKYNPYVYKFGTLNNYSPDSYIFGYHLTQHATEVAGDNFWAEALKYAGRNPYLLDPLHFVYKKYSDIISYSHLTNTTFSSLEDFWQPLTAETNSASLVETPITSYTTYISPLYIDEENVVVVKKNLDRYYRLMKVNLTSGAEKRLCDIGYISTKTIISNNKVYWEEITPSKSWGQKNFATLYSYDLIKGKKRRETKGLNFFYTPYKDGFAAVAFDEQNNPSIVILDKNYNTTKTIPITQEDVSFNGLTLCDNGLLYGAIVDNNGTSIISIDIDNEKIDYFIKPSYNTITNLGSNGNNLYFTSINSGQEEIHEYNVLTNKEYQLTKSRYGSTSSDLSPSGDKLVTTTYGVEGFLLSHQDITRDREVEWQEIPSNELNYPYKEWKNAIKVDTLDISTANLATYKEKKGVKKYSKLSGSANPHSWMPLYFDTDKLIDDRELSYGLGVNVMSQNLLNNTIFTFGYGKVDGYNLYKASLDYNGLPVELGVDVQYGGGLQKRLNFTDTDDSYLNNYFTFNGTISLPLYFSGGGKSRLFRSSISYNYGNDIIYLGSETLYSSVLGDFDPMYGMQMTVPIFETGVERLYSTLSYQSVSQMSSMNINPRLGYYVQLGLLHNPFSDYYGTLYSAYGLGYLPAPLPNGSLTIEAATVYQTNADILYTAMLLVPRGTTFSSSLKRSYSATIDYRVPICYPNGGYKSLLFIKRISAGAFFDYMRYKSSGTDYWSSKNSIGADVIIDFNSISAAAPITFEFSVYKPSDNQGVMCDISFSIDL